MSNVIGPDVSFYQDDPATPQGIDFVKMRGKTPYVIVRAGQNNWADRDVQKNWAAAKAAGLLRGSYWYYDSDGDPKAQAALWISLMDGDLGDLPLWCDFEDRDGGPFGTWKHWYDFLEELKRLAPGKEIGIYTAPYYWVEKTISVGIPIESLNYFKQYPLWIAHYGALVPDVPKPWDTWTFWQFTANGEGGIYGVESKNIDLSYFNGTEAELLTRFGAVAPEAPPTEPMDTGDEDMTTTYYGHTSGTGTRIRDDHNTAGKILVKIPNTNTPVISHEKFVATETLSNANGVYQQAGDVWLKVDMLGAVGWVAVIDKGDPYVMIDRVEGQGNTPPDPIPPVDTTLKYKDMAIGINVFNNEVTVLVDGDEFAKVKQ